MRGIRSKSISSEKYATYWLEFKKTQVARGDLAVATFTSYKSTVENRLIPKLGHLDLTVIRPHDIEWALTPSPKIDEDIVEAYRMWEARDQGRRYRPFGRASIQKWRAILHAIFERAVRDELVNSIPVTAAEKQRISSKEARQKGLTADQFTALLQAARGTDAERYVTLALATGARPSELLALRWSDLDLDGNTVRFNASLGRLKVDGRLERKATKTAKGRRTLPVPASALDPFRQGGDHDAYIFATGTGQPMDIRNFARRSFAPIAASAGIPEATLYTLRHAHATMLLRKGTSSTVGAARLGQTSTKLFDDVYAHSESDLQRDASDSISSLFDRVGGTA